MVQPYPRPHETLCRSRRRDQPPSAFSGTSQTAAAAARASPSSACISGDAVLEVTGADLQQAIGSKVVDDALREAGGLLCGERAIFGEGLGDRFRERFFRTSPAAAVFDHREQVLEHVGGGCVAVGREAGPVALACEVLRRRCPEPRTRGRRRPDRTPSRATLRALLTGPRTPTRRRGPRRPVSRSRHRTRALRRGCRHPRRPR